MKKRIVYNALTILNRMISIQEEMVLVQLGNVAQTRRRPGAYFASAKGCNRIHTFVKKRKKSLMDHFKIV